MKVRVKFSKTGAMKFIGHLDIMRFFQKAIRRAELPVAFSEGFSPHMIMSFAAPLGVGITSAGEYFDMELTEEWTSRELKDRLNAQMVEGMEVLSVRKIPEGKASKAMSLVAAADYLVSFREGLELTGWREKLSEFYGQDSIVILRKTKRSEKETDIRPWILEMRAQEEGIFLRVSQGSVHNLKPELVLEAFARFLGQELSPMALLVHRLEVYAEIEEQGVTRLCPLEDLGENIE